MKNILFKNKYKKTGFSLVETIIFTAVALAIFLAVFQFGSFIFSFNRGAEENLNAQAGARRVLRTMVRELRSASPSSLGAYPLLTVGTSTLIFFSNIDSDPLKERVRYFLSGSELRRGVIKPSGQPLTYNTANEQISTLIRDINNGTRPIFEYFDNTYTGTSNPLVQPVQATNVRLIKITLVIERNPARSTGPFITETKVFLRNLKDNL